jgi:hypothetical protein
MRDLNLDTLWQRLVTLRGVSILTKDALSSAPVVAGLDLDSRPVVAFNVYLTPTDREASVVFIKELTGQWMAVGDVLLISILYQRLPSAMISADFLRDLASGQSAYIDLNA